MLSTVLYYELAMKVPIPVGITVYLLTWGLGHLRCLVLIELNTYFRHDILAQLHQVACDCRLDDCDWRLWTVTVDSRARFLLFVFWP